MNNTQSKRIKYLILLFCTAFQLLPAQKIKLIGEVRDAFLDTPIENVNYYVLNEDRSQILDTAKVVFFKKANGEIINIIYTCHIMPKIGKYWVNATCNNYNDVWQSISVTDEKATRIEVPLIKMKRSLEQKLNEAVVTATKVKMYYKGDTLVYNADAFRLPDGSMLDALIKQMPGVTMSDNGEIFVNGRKVDELLLASRSFMNGNKKVLMENLPYFTVKNIKVYEKQSDRSKALGYDVDPRTYVMDVNLKNKYTNGYIANVEAAYGTKERWIGRGFLLGFTDQWRYSVMGNSNNVNESRHIGESGHWTPMLNPTSLITTHSVAADLDYQSKNKYVKNNTNVSYTSTDTEQEVRQRREQFLDGKQPVSMSKSQSDSENWNLKVSNRFAYNKGFSFDMNTDFSYGKRNVWSNGVFEQSDNDTLTVTQHDHARSGGHNWGFSGRAGGAFNTNKEKQERITYMLLFIHNDEQLWNADRFKLWQDNAPTTELRHNTADISNRRTSYYADATYTSRKFWNGTYFWIRENFQIANARKRDYLYHPDTLLSPSQMDMLNAITDPNNSYMSKRHAAINILTLNLCKRSTYMLAPNSPINISYDRWGIGLDIPYIHRSLDYVRGRIDTLVSDNQTRFSPYAEFRKVSKYAKSDFRISLKYEEQAVDLLDKIDIRDDRNPLVVKLSNPALKDKAHTHFDINYKRNMGKHMLLWNAAASMDYYHRDVVQSTMYNPVNGVYTYRPVNVNGAYYTTAKFDVSRSLDKYNRWTWQMNTNASYHHSIDHAMLAGETASHENIVNTTRLSSSTYIQYNKNDLNIRLSGEASWRNSNGKMRDFKTLNAWDYNYGLSARYTIPVIRTTLSADAMMYSRRGYGSDAFNTDNFIINASISQSLFKGKLIAKIHGFDLLHQLSNVQYEVNAQGRKETWSRSLPHYVMFHLCYHFNKKPTR